MPAAAGAPVSSSPTVSPTAARTRVQMDAWGMTKPASSYTNAVDEKVQDGELRLMLGNQPLAKSLPQQHPCSNSTQQQL